MEVIHPFAVLAGELLGHEGGPFVVVVVQVLHSVEEGLAVEAPDSEQPVADDTDADVGTATGEGGAGAPRV